MPFFKENAFFLEKSLEKFCGFKKNSYLCIRNSEIVLVAKLLGYGVMVTLQILVLSFLVRVRVSQQVFWFMTLGYGVMVTLQILVLSFLVRIRVSQQIISIFQ